MARKRIEFTSVVTCNGMEIVEHSERKEINYNYSTMSNKDISYRQKSLDKTIAKKKRMLGIVEEEPTYYWQLFGIEKVIDKTQAIVKIQNGIDVYTIINGQKKSVRFDGLTLITED